MTGSGGQSPGARVHNQQMLCTTRRDTIYRVLDIVPTISNRPPDRPNHIAPQIRPNDITTDQPNDIQSPPI